MLFYLPVQTRVLVTMSMHVVVAGFLEFSGDFTHIGLGKKQNKQINK